MKLLESYDDDLPQDISSKEIGGSYQYTPSIQQLVSHIMQAQGPLSGQQLYSIYAFQETPLDQDTDRLYKTILMHRPHHVGRMCLMDTLEQQTIFTGQEIHTFHAFLTHTDNQGLSTEKHVDRQEFDRYWQLYTTLFSSTGDKKRSVDMQRIQSLMPGYRSYERTKFLGLIAGKYETQGMGLVHAPIFSHRETQHQEMLSPIQEMLLPELYAVYSTKNKDEGVHTDIDKRGKNTLAYLTPDTLAIRNELRYIHILLHTLPQQQVTTYINMCVDQGIIDETRAHI